MKLIFIDETESPKHNHFYGVGLFVVDSAFYENLSREFSGCLKQIKWNFQKEFKGCYLFSSTQGDVSIDVQSRIDFVDLVTKSLTGKANSRGKFYFGYNHRGKSNENYLFLVQKVLSKIPKVSQRNNGKNLAVVFYDHTNLTDDVEFSDKSLPVLGARGMCQVELAHGVRSSNRTPGIIYADILSYLSAWDVLNPQRKITEQLALFDLNASQRDERKMQVISKLLKNIKSIGYYRFN